jgi:hypothetical protein
LPLGRRSVAVYVLARPGRNCSRRGMQAAAIISSAKNGVEYMAGGATRPKPGRKPRRSGTLME